MQEKQNIWPKHITVDRRIVNVLSQSTYDNFPRALKELITNSYDADAKHANIKIDLNNETITIEDDGKGMSESDFEFYLRIAGQTRSKENNTTTLGRKVIGQFGIGFLSIFPFFKSYSIETKKAGSSNILHATIPLYKYFLNQNKIVDIESIEIIGGSIPVKNNPNSFTKITLKGFNELTTAFFYPKAKADKKLIETFSGVDKLKWILADDLPIEFGERIFNEIFKTISPFFEVFVNGEKLYRQVYGSEILETHSKDFYQIGKIKFRYCILTPRKSIIPYAARGLKIRNLNVGVGDKREDFGAGHGTTRSRIHWLTGEVHILEGMNDLIKISRDGFNYSHDFEEVKSYLNEKLQYFSNKLEQEEDLKKEIRQTGKDFRVSNVRLLKKNAFPDRIKKFKEQGFELKISPKEVLNFEKHIVIGKKRYSVSAESWNYIDEFYPACIIQKDHIILNSSYPLFQGKKYTDVFVKMHLLLLVNFKNKKITSTTFRLLTKEILIYYADYNK
jgi:hypothetical protein